MEEINARARHREAGGGRKNHRTTDGDSRRTVGESLPVQRVRDEPGAPGAQLLPLRAPDAAARKRARVGASVTGGPLVQSGPGLRVRGLPG